ncbi:hypothetical protein Sant_P0252 (plasmid) [Sodalis praecaptivus]|uniref:Uncharacterized protein n=1 Tax=Sodalis praecaptivus TaxID=1239307 RepID=W0HZM8_9GAMM|nr:hypothetical protein Sant_P0252 [Sodalis praecaptivus]
MAGHLASDYSFPRFSFSLFKAKKHSETCPDFTLTERVTIGVPVLEFTPGKSLKVRYSNRPTGYCQYVVNTLLILSTVEAFLHAFGIEDSGPSKPMTLNCMRTLLLIEIHHNL